MKQVPVRFDDRDGMSRDVAIQLLTRKELRVSSATRRVCWEATWKTITSPTPITRSDSGIYLTDADQTRRALPDRLARKMAKFGMAKLCQIKKGTFKRRIAIQRPFVQAEEEYRKMQADTEPSHVVANARRFHLVGKLLTQLAAQAKQLDEIMDAVETEISKRTKSLQ